MYPVMLKVLDPVGETRAAPVAQSERVFLDTLRNKRVGLIWGQHVSTVRFWPALEAAVERISSPSEVHRLYKSSTWNPASSAQIDAMAAKIDYAIIGVGG